MHVRRLILAGALCSAVSACQYLPGHSQEQGSAGSPVSGPVAEGRALLEQGQLDAALAKLQQVPSDPESLYVQGLVWVAKAALAPPPEPEEEGGQVPEFKLEERNALAFFETLTEARPEHAGAHRAIAELLAPHMLAELAASKRRRRSRSEATPAPDLPDFSRQRVLSEFKAAAQHDPSAESLERMIEFCASITDLDCAEEGFKQMIDRDAESAEPRIRYGDFLVQQKKLDEGIAQYDIALVWAPEDAVTRGKIVDIYIGRGDAYARKREWSFAAEEYERAAAQLSDPNSERAKTLREKRAELVRLSGRR
jgi:tetratricopeptide (TPR) repeat protein